MLTTIEIDDSFLAQAIKATGITNKQNLVEIALRRLSRIKGQECVNLLFGTIHWDDGQSTITPKQRKPSSSPKSKAAKQPVKKQNKPIKPLYKKAA